MNLPQVNLLTSPAWEDYELVDSGDGYKLERFGPYLFKRPEPEAIWQPSKSENVWKQAHSEFIPSSEKNGGHWADNQQIQALQQQLELLKLKNTQLMLKNLINDKKTPQRARLEHLKNHITKLTSLNKSEWENFAKVIRKKINSPKLRDERDSLLASIRSKVS